MSEPLHIFISYAHADESFKNELTTMLALLRRQGTVKSWDDRQIDAGSDWRADIMGGMDRCDLALLLISPAFLASDFIQSVEIEHLLARRERDGIRVVPIILRPCLWHLDDIAQTQCLPKDGKAVITFRPDNGERDQVWTDIGMKIVDWAKAHRQAALPARAPLAAPALVSVPAPVNTPSPIASAPPAKGNPVTPAQSQRTRGNPTQKWDRVGANHFDVFLSHSSHDKAIVRALAERMQADGLSVWFDEWAIRIGDSIPNKIEEGLENSTVLILCMSAHAFDSDWAQLENQTFRFRDPINKARRFIPLRLDDAPIPAALAPFKYVDWREMNGQAYNDLLAACRELAIGFPSKKTDFEFDTTLLVHPPNLQSIKNNNDDNIKNGDNFVATTWLRAAISTELNKASNIFQDALLKVTKCENRAALIDALMPKKYHERIEPIRNINRAVKYINDNPDNIDKLQQIKKSALNIARYLAVATIDEKWIGHKDCYHDISVNRKRTAAIYGAGLACVPAMLKDEEIEANSFMIESGEDPDTIINNLEIDIFIAMGLKRVWPINLPNTLSTYERTELCAILIQLADSTQTPNSRCVAIFIQRALFTDHPLSISRTRELLAKRLVDDNGYPLVRIIVWGEDKEKDLAPVLVVTEQALNAAIKTLLDLLGDNI